MAQNKIRVGLVGATAGAERWGYRAHIPALKALPEVELIAVCTAHKETAEEARRQTGAKLAFWDYKEMVRSKEVDLVSVAVRIPLHFPIVMAALEAGKHVFCEWPLAMDASQATQMHNLALQQGVYHGVGTQARFSPGVMYAKELIGQEYVGRPLVFHMTLFLGFGLGPRRSDRWWSVKAESGGGALNISCGHALDVLRWCLGEVEEVWGKVDTLLKETRFVDTGEVVPVTASDTVVLMPRLAGSIGGAVHISNVCKFGGGFRLEVYGTEGRLTVEAPGYPQYSPVKVCGARGQEGFRELPVPQRFTEVSEIPPDSQSFQVAQLLRRFIRVINQGQGEEFHPNFGEAVRLHKTLEAVKRSSESGKWERVA